MLSINYLLNIQSFRCIKSTRRINIDKTLCKRLSSTINSTSSIFEKYPQNKGFYQKSLEKDSCGVGLVANIKKQASRQIILDANEMLVRMSHRGGCGCEPNTGDGAGILLGMPDSFYRRALQESNQITLGPKNSFGTGILFTPKDEKDVETIKNIFQDLTKQRGFNVLGWRTLKTNNQSLGESAIVTEPRMEQIFIENSQNLPFRDFDRELFCIRKLVEEEVASKADISGKLYVCSLSSQTITYKGQLTPEQVMVYFDDLQQPDFTSHMALVHSRFSTNTFPSWDRAQPCRMMCHNGEINTLRGNKNLMFSRESLMTTDLFKDDDLSPFIKATSSNMSDSGNFDSVLELLSKGSIRSLPECMMMMIPEAWQDNDELSASKRAFYEYNSCLMEPWDGPAMIAFTDGQYIGATLDRNGLRPSRYYVTKDDRVLLSSEIGVLSELPESIIKHKARLEPGKMFLVDFDSGQIVSDNIIKESVAKRFEYSTWLSNNRFYIDDWVTHSKVKIPRFNFDDTHRKLTMFGYTSETVDLLLYPMAVGGKEALGSSKFYVFSVFIT